MPTQAPQSHTYYQAKNTLLTSMLRHLNGVFCLQYRDSLQNWCVEVNSKVSSSCYQKRDIFIWQIPQRPNKYKARWNNAGRPHKNSIGELGQLVRSRWGFALLGSGEAVHSTIETMQLEVWHHWTISLQTVNAHFLLSISLHGFIFHVIDIKARS